MTTLIWVCLSAFAHWEHQGAYMCVTFNWLKAVALVLFGVFWVSFTLCLTPTNVCASVCARACVGVCVYVCCSSARRVPWDSQPASCSVSFMKINKRNPLKTTLYWSKCFYLTIIIYWIQISSSKCYCLTHAYSCCILFLAGRQKERSLFRIKSQ